MATWDDSTFVGERVSYFNEQNLEDDYTCILIVLAAACTYRDFFCNLWPE